MTDRRPPQWASRHRIVRRSPLTRLRDFTPARPADVVPTLVLPPQAGHDSCIVDYSTGQSQMQTILRGRARAPLRAGLDRRHAGDQGRDDHRLPGRGATPRCSRPATAAPSTSWATARAAGWPPSTPRCTPSASTRSPSPARRSTSTPATPSSTRACRRSATTTCPSSARSSRQGNGVLKGEFLLGGFIVIKPENEVGKQLQLLANVRDARHVERYRAFEDWFKHTQDIAGPFYLWLVEHLFRDNELIGGTLRIGDEAVDLGPHRLPREPPGRRHRPHHAARAGLRARRRRRHARQAHHATHDVGRPSRAVHGHRGAARPLAGRHGVGARALAPPRGRRPARRRARSRTARARAIPAP